MAKYMRDRFAFLGIPSPLRRQLHREALAGLPRPTEEDVLEAAAKLWRLPEREFQYAALDLLAGSAKRLTPATLPECERLITAKSWWDTVDGLAGSVVGAVVLGFPECVATMDRWIDHEDLWLRRSAILHQLKWKERTDTRRLFRYCLARAHETDFFIRKAIGWALRQYSWTDADAVAAFVAAHEAELSPLSKREALLAINGGRKGRRVEAGASAQ
jgi:3-methyladenine DNA glycosylase AlkD